MKITPPPPPSRPPRLEYTIFRAIAPANILPNILTRKTLPLVPPPRHHLPGVKHIYYYTFRYRKYSSFTRCTRPPHHVLSAAFFFFLNSQQTYLSLPVCVRVCFDTGRTSTTTERRHFAHSGTRIESDQESRVRHPQRLSGNVAAHRHLCDRRLEDVDQEINKRVNTALPPLAKIKDHKTF